jgi:nicotinamide-nucleotide amidase
MSQKLVKEVVKILKKRGWCIGVMESCTGGAIANLLTNIPGVSAVFKEGLVTYSIESKIKAGVDENIIKKEGVFSLEVAKEMAKKINGDIGIGVTGELPGMVYMAVRVKDKISCKKLKAENKVTNKVNARIKMKDEVVGKVIEMILSN